MQWLPHWLPYGGTPRKCCIVSKTIGICKISKWEAVAYDDFFSFGIANNILKLFIKLCKLCNVSVCVALIVLGIGRINLAKMIA